MTFSPASNIPTSVGRIESTASSNAFLEQFPILIQNNRRRSILALRTTDKDKILILGHDHGITSEGFAPDHVIRSGCHTYVADMDCVVALRRDCARQRGRQLRIDNELQDAVRKIG